MKRIFFFSRFFVLFLTIVFDVKENIFRVSSFFRGIEGIMKGKKQKTILHILNTLELDN